MIGGLFSQSAEFSQQYLQRLGGATDEMRAVVERFDASARAEQLPPDTAIAKLKASADTLAARQGRNAEINQQRYRELAAQYRTMLGSAPVMRPFELLQAPDWPLVKRTGDDYRPAIPTTGDGVLFALFGFIVGWGCGASAHGAVSIRRRRRRRQAALERNA
nr:DUF2937 family protein [Jiella flava]